MCVKTGVQIQKRKHPQMFVIHILKIWITDILQLLVKCKLNVYMWNNAFEIEWYGLFYGSMSSVTMKSDKYYTECMTRK
jgi:hypothetical protein